MRKNTPNPNPHWLSADDINPSVTLADDAEDNKVTDFIEMIVRESVHLMKNNDNYDIDSHCDDASNDDYLIKETDGGLKN